ncbi:hypothetical protein M8C21_031681 [Ambrosia artemisiifolia]|uniref:Uncharacterized protein n=1 Tax=Ambrosia artemisiifolia TaxID=4212 RepID=A0AAD5D950_AMBAR|nr:hypothetical protein M8C21_031681 [Ambrosia artemisiifolia]
MNQILRMYVANPRVFFILMLHLYTPFSVERETKKGEGNKPPPPSVTTPLGTNGKWEPVVVPSGTMTESLRISACTTFISLYEEEGIGGDVVLVKKGAVVKAAQGEYHRQGLGLLKTKAASAIIPPRLGFSRSGERTLATLPVEMRLHRDEAMMVRGSSRFLAGGISGLSWLYSVNIWTPGELLTDINFVSFTKFSRSFRLNNMKLFGCLHSCLVGAQGTEMQLASAVECKNATLSVKRRLACEQLSYFSQAHYCLSTCDNLNGYGKKHISFIKWKYLEAKAATYYYNGLITDKGTEPSCHITAMAPTAWGAMKHLNKKIPENAAKKSQMYA